MRLEDYRRFDAELFLNDKKIWQERKKRLQSELDALSALPAVNNESGVRGSDISDPTASAASKKWELTNAIMEIEICEDAYRYSLSQLEPEEKELILGFFEPKIPIWKFRQRWQLSHGMGDTKMYKERSRILRKISDIIEEIIE